MGADSTRPGPPIRPGAAAEPGRDVHYGLLGPLLIVRDGWPVELGGPRLRTLATLLLIAEGDVVPAGTLIEGIWGEHVPANVENALQALVSRLRAVLGRDVVQAAPGGYRLDVAPERLDTVRFGRLLERGRTAVAGGDPAEAARLVREALGLWRGRALADAEDSEAARPAIARLEAARVAAIEERVEAELGLGENAGELVAELTGLVVEHPLRERLRAQLMRALAAGGRYAEALAAYEDARRVLAEELGADPSPDLAAVHLEILRAEAGPRTNLRPSPTSFVGRDALMERLRELLDGTRLVTLTGPGGAGKTRLAVETAAGLHEEAPDGVWLVELAHLTDPAEVVQAVLSALGVRDGGMRRTRALADPYERLEAALKGSRSLIILDNCEHLVGAAAELAERLVTGTSDVRVLATSREALNVAGERICSVPPLGIEASRRLFADRAAGAGAPKPMDPGAVDRICRELDGIPLAIELAAARTRVLAAEEIADRLDDRFRLLTGGSRTALPRHRTLRAVVEWSWDLLGESERRLARRFAVFAGGATLEAAEAVCDADLDALTGLVEKSLLVSEGTTPGRYHMLETIRAYALERLSEAGEEEAVRRAHARHWLEFAEGGTPRCVPRTSSPGLRASTPSMTTCSPPSAGA